MAELLAQWLNEEVGLSKTVTNFEDDFASGYLFGELLYKFNQLSEFHNFSTKNATSHYVMNFEKLEPTLRSLNVQFSSKTVEKIMSRERGQALRLLYQLKMVLEKVYPPADISIVAKTGTFGDNQPAQRIAFSKPKYDEVTHNFFKSRLGKLNRAQKDIDLENHLRKFDEEAARQASQAARLDAADKKADARAKQEMRRIQINKLQRNAGFMEEWLSKGVEDWKANMTVKREREAAQLEFQFTQAEMYNTIAQNKLKEAQDEVFDGIENFERNLRARGINTEVSQEEAHRAVDATLQGKTWQGNATVTSNAGTAAELTVAKTFDQKALTRKGNFTLTSTGLKHRTKKTVTDESRREREKRRRRLINQQATLMLDLEQASREAHVSELMRRQARQEKELDYEAWRTTQCKTIIIENRQLREVQYKERRKYDVELSEFKEQRLLAEMQDASTREINQMVQRTEELKQYEQQYKLKQRTKLCSGLMDAIFDIADEAYNHMQDLDAKQWDSRNWENWVELFIHQKQISGVMGELLSSEGGASDAQEQLDESTLRNYLQNTHQWPTSLVSESNLNLADIINPKVEAAAPAKGGKAAGKAPTQADVLLEEADLELSDKPANNFLFGDVIDQLIKLHFPPRPDLKHPPTPNWLSLKVCLAGYPHSWTREQTAQLQAKYGVDVFEMETLVKEALDYTGDVEYPAIAAPEAKEGSDFEDLSEDEALSTDLNEQMKALSDEIREQLLSGEEIRDELYVKLFVHKLRSTYEYKCPVTRRREVQVKAKRQVEINSRMGDIAQELAKEDISKKLRKQLHEEQAALELELGDLDKQQTKGWILVDFPCSYAQAKLLEEALSGYKPLEEMEPTDREIETKRALQLVKPSPQEQQPDTLIKSGLDAVIWFNCSPEECLKRAEGPRVDSADPENQFHVFNALPPTNQATLCERLLPINPVDDQVQGLPDRFVAFDQNTSSMQRWLRQFGDEEKDRILVNFIDNERQEDLSTNIEKVSDIFDCILKHRAERYEELKDRLVAKYQELEEERRLREAEEAAAAAQREQSIESASPGGEETAAQVSPRLSTSKSKDLTKGKRGSDVGLTAGTSQVEKSLESSARAPTFSRDNVEVEFRPTLITLWQELSSNYRGQMKHIFRNVRRYREQAFKQQSLTQQNFLKFIHRLDNKQELLDQFVREFNTFSDDFPDLREDPQTKEELHQRCDVLSDELWEIVEDRKEQNVEERKKIMESGQCENGQEFYTLTAQQLMQAELDKFKISIQILHDYYFAIEEKPTHEITAPTTSELVFNEGEEVPPAETLAEGQDPTQIANYFYPRLDKLLQMALKQQVVPDITLIQANAEKDKKGGKPAAGKGKGASKEAEQETIVEESAYVKEMKEAIKVEKSILRFRLVQIHQWALERVRYQRQSALNMYKKFEDWIQVAQKAEMDTIEEMCAVVKRAIEDETKIQNELCIKFMDFSVNHTTLNFINPPKPKLPALEEFSSTRFSIPMLTQLVAEFEVVARSTGDLMQCRELVNLVYSKIKSGVQFGGVDTGFPESWGQYGLSQINQMIRNIDTRSTGYVDWRTLATCFILICSQVPSAKEVSRIEKMLGEEATEAAVCQGAFWFDECERSADRDYSIEFERVRMIKQLLFRVHSSGADSMSVARFATTLGAIAHKAESEESTFFDVLFAKVRI